jgi:two-component system phosphate regulon sensor histidine kinase PhoR
MRIHSWNKVNLLCALAVGLIVAGVGLSLQRSHSVDLIVVVLVAAALLFVSAMPVIHFTLLKPIRNLRREVETFARQWLDRTPAGGEIDSVTNGLKDIHEVVDRSTLRVKELEATINVYSIEKEQMEAVLRSLPIAVLVTDRYNELMLSNDAAQRLFEMENTQDRPVAEILRWQELVELIEETANRKVKVPRRVVELPYQEEGGDPKVFRIILSSIADHTNQILGVVTIIQDATKDREIDRMKSEFVANVSHELKTPLSSIKAYTEMLLDGEAQDEESRKEFCTIIESETDRLSSMIDNLLDLSRLEAGVIEMNMERVNLITMLKSIEDTMRPTATKKRIELKTDISQYIVPVLGDAGQLNRVFVNLVSNAIKYTKEGGRVDIKARLEGDLIRVDVRDSGLGIPEESLSKIFEKFYRVKENQTAAKGTGMGLAMVKRILEIHNAEIKVNSKVAEGSCFSVFIPTAD